MTKLTHKDAKFVWTSKCEPNFQEIKKWLTMALVLALLVSSEDFVIYLKGLGSVLIWKDNVIIYASWKLKSNELNYPNHDLELAVVIFILKIWWHYLYGYKFYIFTYHLCLKNFLTQKDINMRQQHWLEYMKDYGFTVAYHPGKVNMVADT